MVADQEMEAVDLDFKQIEDRNAAQLSDSDLGNIAKAMSAFGNVEGGVLLLGIQTSRAERDQPDRAAATQPLAAALQVYAHLDRLAAALTEPQVPGFDVLFIPEPGSTTSGVLALYVPQSDAGPFRAARGPASGRYYQRTATNSVIMPHSILAALFGRQPPPVLRFELNYNAFVGCINLWMLNVGRGVADDVLVRVSVREADNSTLAHEVHRGPFWNSWANAIVGTRGYDHLISRGPLPIYPQDPVVVLSWRGNIVPQRLLVWGRVDCRGAMPFEVEEVVTLDNDRRVPVASRPVSL